MLKGKTVVMGVTGGIACYKAANIVSMLKKLGANVHVLMTKSATQFVSPLTFQTLSKNRVVTDMFDAPNHWEVEHISLAESADIFLIAPATANIIGKIANGIADDMLSTTVMATKAKVVIAPAMNSNMYENPIVQKNIEYLKSLGYIFVNPESGMLACGTCGNGRLANEETIVETVVSQIAFTKDFAGKNVLVTAGATQEALDPVRYITNHSTGKMGYAIAKAAYRRGANVKLVSAPSALHAPSGIEVINVTSAIQMCDAVMQNSQWADVIIKSAAVGDYRPKQQQEQKIKKDSDMTLELVKNPDILQQLGMNKRPDQVLIGFCMETQNLLDNATEKLKKKNCDIMIANNLFDKGAGFAHDTNTVTVLKPDEQPRSLPNMSKDDLAHIILDECAAEFKKRA